MSGMKRKIIEIDESKCSGCGNCVTSCAEGALALINGKARLIKEQYCDGLAACLKECPTGALKIVEREAEEFNEEAVREHLQKPAGRVSACPGSAVRQLEPETPAVEDRSRRKSDLAHWPVQLALVPPGAPFLDAADLVLVADCVPFAYPDLHRDFLKGHAVAVACPKLDDAEAHLERLTEILRRSRIKSLSVVHMEVPCCSGLVYLVKKALAQSGKNLPLQEITIGIKGEILGRVQTPAAGSAR